MEEGSSPKAPPPADDCAGCHIRDDRIDMLEKAVATQKQDICRLLEDTKRALEINATQMALDQSHEEELNALRRAHREEVEELKRALAAAQAQIEAAKCTGEEGEALAEALESLAMEREARAAGEAEGMIEKREREVMEKEIQIQLKTIEQVSPTPPPIPSCKALLHLL